MTINTGGVDVTQQTGGVGINLVTKSGTDKFKGSGRFYDTNDKFESQQHHRRAARAGRDLGQPDPEHQGLRLRNGRPDQEGQGLDLGRFGKQNVDVGVLGFYQPTAACQAIKATGANPLAHPIDGRQRLPEHRPDDSADHQPEGEVQLFKGNKLSLFNSFAMKERNARGAERPAPDRDDDAAGRGADATLRLSAGWTIGPEPDLQVRRPVGAQRPAAARRAVRARRQQLHPRLPRSVAAPTCSRRSSSPASLNGRSTPTAAVGEHPSGQQRERQHELLHAGHDGSATTRSSSAATGATTTATNSTHTPRQRDRRASRPRPSWPTRTTARRSATGCQVQLTRDGQTAYDLLNISALRAGHDHARTG